MTRPKQSKESLRSGELRSIADMAQFPWDWFPEFHFAQIADVVHRVVAATRYTRHLIAGERVHERHVYRIALKGTSPQVAVQAFAIIVRGVELNFFRTGRMPEILDVDVAQAAGLGSQAAIEAVVGVTRIASLVRRNSMILEVRGRDVGWVVHVQTLPVGLHNVTGKTKCGLL